MSIQKIILFLVMGFSLLAQAQYKCAGLFTDSHSELNSLISKFEALPKNNVGNLHYLTLTKSTRIFTLEKDRKKMTEGFFMEIAPFWDRSIESGVSLIQTTKDSHKSTLKFTTSEKGENYFFGPSKIQVELTLDLHKPELVMIQGATTVVEFTAVSERLNLTYSINKVRLHLSDGKVMGIEIPIPPVSGKMSCGLNLNFLVGESRVLSGYASELFERVQGFSRS